MKYDPEHPGHAPDGAPMDVQPRWRRDFPIDTPQDDYVARRDFTKFMVLTSFAFFIGQLWIGVQNMIRKRRGKPPITRIASLDELAVGASMMFAYPGPNDDCLLIRPDSDTLLAYSQKCTHLQCGVVARIEKKDLYCPCHHGYFDLTTGRAIAGPPSRPLPRITLQVRRGEIYATGVELRTV